MKSRNTLSNRQRFYVPPDGDGKDFKTLFNHLAAAGAGRPVDEHGFPQGPWTPDLLTEAISQIDANQAGIELRTVQLWFQDNDKGISPDNIRWLARIFGCDNPEATSAWQVELSSSQTRLIAQRRQRRQPPASDDQGKDSSEEPAAAGDDTIVLEAIDDRSSDVRPVKGFSLARKSEAIFGGGSFLDLPASVFAGAIALGFMSVFLGVHSISYAEDNGALRQVGFLWAPNWTLLFMIFMPLFLGFSREILTYWKNEGRAQLVASNGGAGGDDGWRAKVEASPLTYWAVFLVCVGFAGIFQWISVRLIPLLEGGGDYAFDWGFIGILRPEVVSIAAEAIFTALAYLYMCLCFYLFFVGLILIYTMVYDYKNIRRLVNTSRDRIFPDIGRSIGERIMRGIFRCTLSGVLIAICMKLQAIYLLTNSENILEWLTQDFTSVVIGQGHGISLHDFTAPTQYTSLLIILVTCFVFVSALTQIKIIADGGASSMKMAAIIALLVVSYMTIGAFQGFSILLGASVLLAIYGLLDPRLGSGPKSNGARVIVS
ncbi:hypothetical protein E4191_18045 (plasmid) [Paracoccus liaowanqingii]|uniref:Transmembrane protein n=1 Tax=Paracoccus liaowanqingii TaxID=2560053 RepID=A0A4Y5SRB2_9RHOB|nr:hypothetical protein [Paracoccus liaowanqingii]QDA36037.1 hypothetical protein E4191_18045 [Paracoccus liaowanqingii]